VSQLEITKKIYKTPYFGVQGHSRSLNSTLSRRTAVTYKVVLVLGDIYKD